MKIKQLFLLLSCIVMSSCASTTYNSTGINSQRPLCQVSGKKISTLIIWSPEWRPNHKDVAMREIAAQKGIVNFFTNRSCYTNSGVIKATNDQALTIAKKHPSSPSRVINIIVKELGPVLKLQLAPAFVEGGTEVVFKVSAQDVNSGQQIANFTSHWQNGGPFVIKGVGSLEKDMYSALLKAFPDH